MNRQTSNFASFIFFFFIPKK